MINIDNNISQIRNAYSGREFRNVIADALSNLGSFFKNQGSNRDVITVNKATLSGGVSTDLSLNFTPTEMTKVVATLRHSKELTSDTTTDGELKLNIILAYHDSKITAYICSGDGSEIPPGTYYVDWFVVEK